MSCFDSHAFHDTLPKGKSSGQLSIDSHTLHFEGGGQSHNFSLDNCTISLGGASNRLVYIHDKTQPDWVLYTADRSFLKSEHIQGHPQLAQHAKQARGKRHGSWAVLWTVLLLIILSPIGLYLSVPWLTKVAANHVPPEWEESLGKAAFAQYQVDYDMMHKNDIENYLQPLSDPLIKALDNSPYSYQLYIANEESINAFALPGGYIVIHSGLILAADTPEELLGVLAHEISHVTEKHSIRNIISSLGVYFTLSLVIGDVSGLAAIISSAAPMLINQSFSRDFERDADKVGFNLLQAANINPKGLSEFFETIKEEEQKRIDKMSDDTSREVIERAFSILSTHPATDERINYIQTLISHAKPQNYQNLNTDFTALKTQVEKFVIENK